MKSYLDDKDIFESQAEVLVNPVNCKGIIEKGLALQFKNKYPQIYETYHRDCEKGALKAGFCYFYYHFNGKIIACLTTKDDWHNISKLNWVKSGIRQLRTLMEDGRFTSVAIPRVDCELDWNHVRPMIIKELYGCKFDVWLDGEVFERNRNGINTMGTGTEYLIQNKIPEITKKRIASITVYEYENQRSNRQFTLLFEILSPKIKTETDLIEAVQKACTEFVKTEKGKEIYSHNCENFNWADFEMDVPEETCQKYGFKRLEHPDTEMDFTVNWDEHLVNDNELLQE